MQSSLFETSSAASYLALRRISTLILASVLLVALSACDSTDSNDNDDGDDTPPETVTMSIGGSDVELSAFFASGTDPETGEEAFLVYLTESNNLSGDSDFQSGGTFGILGRSSTRPGTGTYSVADVTQDDSDELLREQFAFIYFENVGGDGQRIVISNGGTVDITSSSSSRVSGSFDISGLSTTFSSSGFSEEDVSIQGSFDASNAPFFFPGDFDF